MPNRQSWPRRLGKDFSADPGCLRRKHLNAKLSLHGSISRAASCKSCVSHSYEQIFLLLYPTSLQQEVIFTCTILPLRDAARVQRMPGDSPVSCEDTFTLDALWQLLHSKKMMKGIHEQRAYACDCSPLLQPLLVIHSLCCLSRGWGRLGATLLESPGSSPLAPAEEK